MSKDAEERELSFMLDNLVNNLKIGIAIFEISDDIICKYFNDGFSEISGRTKEQIDSLSESGELFSKVIFEPDQMKFISSVQKHAKEGSAIDESYRYIHANGNVKWIQVKADKIGESKNGKPLYYASFTTPDYESTVYRNMIDASPTGVFAAERSNRRILYLNPTMCKIYGIADYNSFDGKFLKDVVPENEWFLTDKEIDSLTDDKYLIFHKQIRDKFYAVKAKADMWTDIPSYIAFISDETDARKRYEDQIKKYEAELATRKRIGKDSDVEICYNATRRRVLDSEQSSTLFPYIASGTSGDDFLTAYEQIVCDNNRQSFFDFVKVENVLERLSDGREADSSETYMKLKDGKLHWVRMTYKVEPESYSGDTIIYCFIKIIDEEKKSSLAFESVIDDSIEFIGLIDVKTSKVRILRISPFYKVRRKKSGLEVDYKDICYLYEEGDYSPVGDDNQVEYLYSVEGLVKKLSKKKTVIYTYVLHEDKDIYLENDAYYLDDSHEKIVMSIKNITRNYLAARKQKQELQDALDKAYEANNAKSSFLSRMSHDMRTPLNAVLGLTSEEIIESLSPEEILSNMRTVHNSGQYLLGIINDILDMSKIENKKLELNPEPYSFKEFESVIKNIVGEQCKNKNIKFEIPVGEGVQQYYFVDKTRFNQIMVNLLSNAIKFTPEGGKVGLYAIALDNDEEMQSVRFIVKDNGMGMSKDFIPRAFDSFSQEGHDEDGGLKGTGLGLSIVKSLVTMMNGTIRIESELGIGTSFIVDLKLKTVPEKESEKLIEKSEKKENTEAETNQLKGKQILLCEDNEINAQVAEMLLTHVGCIVTMARNGEEGVRTFKASKENFYDCILMDIRMPVMDGFMATKAIRALDRLDAKTIPIIAMTANAFDDDVKQSRESGMNAHLAKPIETVKLYETLTEFLH